jgi:NAD(P)-dependent dehydrogenase (short-subunit alcohol dehydrogenase family)
MDTENQEMKQAFPTGVAIVIGGSGGIGAAICKSLAEAGSSIALTYRRNRANAEVTAEQVRQAGQSASIYQLDMSDSKSADQVVQEITATHRIHTVVIAAGSDISQEYISKIEPEEWQSVISNDLNGFFNIAHATLPHMRNQGGGTYVHISSTGVHRWPRKDALSVAPKAAIDSLIKGIAKEEGRFNIRANSVAIGVINAGIFKRLCDDGTFDQTWLDYSRQALCIQRWGEAKEVADAVTFLASNKAAYITGQTLSVDGGFGV